MGNQASLVGTLAIGLIAIAALYFARDVFVPLALAVLLSFALGPLVALLRRWHLGRVPSVIAAVLLAFFVIFGVGSLIGGQLAHLAENLPQYQTNIMDKNSLFARFHHWERDLRACLGDLEGSQQ